jgi:hypothetical protein
MAWEGMNVTKRSAAGAKERGHPLQMFLTNSFSVHPSKVITRTRWLSRHMRMFRQWVLTFYRLEGHSSGRWNVGGRN